MLIAIDTEFFWSINGLAGRNSALDAFGIFFATYAIVVLVAVAVFIAMRRGAKGDRRGAAMFIGRGAAAVAVAIIINELIAMAFFRDRPFVALADVVKLADVSPYLKSFPSDHAASAFVIATTLAWERRRFAIPIFVIAALIAITRVFVGVHYPFDVIAGAVVGVGSAFFVRWFLPSTIAII